jgi:hypothetical protein
MANAGNVYGVLVRACAGKRVRHANAELRERCLDFAIANGATIRVGENGRV